MCRAEDPTMFDRATCSVEEARAILGVTRGQMRGMVSRNLLPVARAANGASWQPGGQLRIDARALADNLEGEVLNRYELWQAGAPSSLLDGATK